jgi:uncharacterized protein (DUF111 family)
MRRTPTRRTAHLSSILKSFAPRRLSSGEARASRAFQLLGEAEAAIHSIPIEEVHFHEVGAVDTIVDIVCAAAGAEALLGVERWLASPLNVGSGTVKSASTARCPCPRRPRWLCWAMRRSTRPASRWSA